MSCVSKMKKVTSGFLITVEGIDGSGKSVFSKALHQALKTCGYDAVLTREPGGTPLGDRIRELLFDTQTPPTHKAEFLLFSASRAQHVETFIAPAIDAGSIVISDRMADSSLVYQGYLRGLSLDMIKQVNAWALGSVQPLHTLYLKVDAQTALKRITHRNHALSTFEDDIAKLEKAIEGFELLVAHRPEVIVLDATQTTDTLVQDALAALQTALSAHTHE